MSEEKKYKKILYVTRPIAPPWDEASKNFAYTLAKGLENFEIHILTDGSLLNLPPHIKQEPVYTSNKLSFFQKIRLWKLKKVLRRKEFSLAHFMLTPNQLNSWAFKNFLTSKKIRTIQTVATLREDLYSKDKIKKLLFADLIITYSDYAKNKLTSLGLKNVQRVYPGIDLENYKPQEKNPELLSEFNFSASDFVINFSGEYTRLGAIDLVINSFVEVSQKIPKAKLSLAVRIKNEKDAQKKEAVIKLLKEKNILDKIAFHDDGQYNMKDIYNLADISLFPVDNMKGKFDIPLAVVEAMACEKPVILSNLEILKELGERSDSLIVERNNQNQLVAAIMDLYNNSEKRNLLGKQARKFVEENFSIKKIAQDYSEIYNSL